MIKMMDETVLSENFKIKLNDKSRSHMSQNKWTNPEQML